jgi:hypothetical protein
VAGSQPVQDHESVPIDISQRVITLLDNYGRLTATEPSVVTSMLSTAATVPSVSPTR